MSSAIITLIGLYDYDPTLFDNLIVPYQVQKDLLIDCILMRGGDYEVVYPNPNLLKELIGSWSHQWSTVFGQWARATDDIKKIAPLENYDRIEHWDDSGTHHDTSSSTSHDAMVGHGKTDGSDETRGTGNSNGTNTVSAYDSSGLVNDTGSNQNTSSSTNSTTSTTSNTNTTSDANTSGQSDGTTSSTHDARIHGNIGVVTAGKMYEEFYLIMQKYGNIYESIATVFLQAFVIPLL